MGGRRYLERDGRRVVLLRGIVFRLVWLWLLLRCSVGVRRKLAWRIMIVTRSLRLGLLVPGSLLVRLILARTALAVVGGLCWSVLGPRPSIRLTLDVALRLGLSLLVPGLSIRLILAAVRGLGRILLIHSPERVGLTLVPMILPTACRWGRVLLVHSPERVGLIRAGFCSFSPRPLLALALVLCRTILSVVRAVIRSVLVPGFSLVRSIRSSVGDPIRAPSSLFPCRPRFLVRVVLSGASAVSPTRPRARVRPRTGRRSREKSLSAPTVSHRGRMHDSSDSAGRLADGYRSRDAHGVRRREGNSSREERRASSFIEKG